MAWEISTIQVTDLRSQSAKVAANEMSGLILNHMRGQPETWSKLPPMQESGRNDRARTRGDGEPGRAMPVWNERYRDRSRPRIRQSAKKQNARDYRPPETAERPWTTPFLIGPIAKVVFSPSPRGRNTFWDGRGRVAAAVLNGAHIVRVTT